MFHPVTVYAERCKTRKEEEGLISTMWALCQFVLFYKFDNLVPKALVQRLTKHSKIRLPIMKMMKIELNYYHVLDNHGYGAKQNSV